MPLGPAPCSMRSRRSRRPASANGGTFTRRCTRSSSKSMSTACCSTRRSDLLEAQGPPGKADRDDVAAGARQRQPKSAEAGATRVADALFKSAQDSAKAGPSIDFDARFTMSGEEILRPKDFAQMSAAEIEEARKAIGGSRCPTTGAERGGSPPAAAARIDPRRSFRRSLQPGGAIDLAFRAPVERAPPIVALCDISGSMSEYTRLFLHFLHALGETRRVSTFLFGTRLTNVTRAMRARDPDEALARCAARRSIGRAARGSARRSAGSTAIGRGACSGRARSCSSSPTGSSATASIGSGPKWSGWPNRAGG